MVSHKTIGDDVQLVLLTVFFQPAEIYLPIFIRVKNIFTTISTLGNMVRHTGKYCSCYSWEIVTQYKTKGSVPFNSVERLVSTINHE